MAVKSSGRNCILMTVAEVTLIGALPTSVVPKTMAVGGWSGTSTIQVVFRDGKFRVGACSASLYALVSGYL